MTRVKNYLDFVCVFTGLSFTGAWAFAPDRFAASLSPGLQGAGLAMAAYAAVRLVALMHGRATAPQPAKLSALSRRHAPPRMKHVEPRQHFGLRGTRR